MEVGEEGDEGEGEWWAGSSGSDGGSDGAVRVTVTVVGVTVTVTGLEDRRR